jgi:Mn-dependent DtxR family transcriptional regulator
MRKGLEFRIFILLKEKGGLRIRDISSYLGVSYHSVFKAIKNLEKKGYVIEEDGIYRLVKKVWMG